MRPILVVISAPKSRQNITKILSEAGYDIIEAASGEAALQMAPNVLPDLVLMAIVISGPNGLQTAAKLRTLLGSKPVRVILLGSVPPIGIHDEPLASLVDDYL